ncbi:hypothetical protein AND_008655 [Anopheles darlingi]|uniref:Uncharacterized protein n=1 Tax=Anopheles darlingi TaxID=43151 RepID=W5J8N4_ANODA|nr:hypothetical protein AND_008655 [Anopheles darlingi]
MTSQDGVGIEVATRFANENDVTIKQTAFLPRVFADLDKLAALADTNLAPREFPEDTLMCMFVPQLRNVLHDQLHHGGDGGEGYCGSRDSIGIVGIVGIGRLAGTRYMLLASDTWDALSEFPRLVLALVNHIVDAHSPDRLGACDHMAIVPSKPYTTTTTTNGCRQKSSPQCAEEPYEADVCHGAGLDMNPEVIAEKLKIISWRAIA